MRWMTVQTHSSFYTSKHFFYFWFVRTMFVLRFYFISFCNISVRTQTRSITNRHELLQLHQLLLQSETASPAVQGEESLHLKSCLFVYWVVFILFRQGHSSHQPVLYFSYIEISTMSASFIWSINTLFIIYHYKVAVDSAPVINECPPCVGTHISSHSILGPTRFSHTTTWLTSASRSCHHSGCSGVAWSGIPPPAPTAPGTCTKKFSIECVMSNCVFFPEYAASVSIAERLACPADPADEQWPS